MAHSINSRILWPSYDHIHTCHGTRGRSVKGYEIVFILNYNDKASNIPYNSSHSVVGRARILMLFHTYSLIKFDFK